MLMVDGAVRAGDALLGEMEFRQVPHFRPGRAFLNAINTIHREAGQLLRLASGRPKNFHGFDFLCRTEADFLPQWRRTKAAAAAYGFVNRTRTGGGFCDDADARANGRAIRLNAFERQRDPM